MLFGQGVGPARRFTIAPTMQPLKPGEGGLNLGRHGGLRRSAGRVAADVPRGLAHPARLLLRPRPPRARPRGDAEEVRALPRQRRAPRRPELPVPARCSANMSVGHHYVGGGDAPRPEARAGRAARARTTRSRTAATASPASTTARTGTRSSAPRSPSRASTSRPASTCSPSTAARSGATDNVYSFFESTAGQAGRASRSARTPTAPARAKCTVVPVASEDGAAQPRLDRRATAARWIKMSGGKLAYVYLPDTARRRLHQLQPLLLRPESTRRAR